MNRQNLLSRLAARGWPIVYSHGALSLWERKGSGWKMAPLLNSIEYMDGVSVVRPGRATARWPRSSTWDRWSIRRHCDFMRSALGDRGRHVAAFCFDPSFAPYVDELRPKWLFFHAYDVYSRMRYWDERKQKEFERLLARADLVTAATEAIAESLPLGTEREVRVLHNGADVSMFADASQLPCPADLAAIPHPRIGNAGTLNRKMDFGLIADIAEIKPDWHWVLVGKVAVAEIEGDTEARAGFARCKAMKNIHMLGERNRLEVPAYVGHMDVNTICYRIRPNEWVSAGYPVKLNEYLAAGLPVVAAPQDAIRRYFSDVAFIAEGVDGWIAALAAAIKESDSAGRASLRIHRATENSWDNRVDQLETWITACAGSDLVELPARPCCEAVT